jgi:hypothetical protein
MVHLHTVPTDVQGDRISAARLMWSLRVRRPFLRIRNLNVGFIQRFNKTSVPGHQVLMLLIHKRMHTLGTAKIQPCPYYHRSESENRPHQGCNTTCVHSHPSQNPDRTRKSHRKQSRKQGPYLWTENRPTILAGLPTEHCRLSEDTRPTGQEWRVIH